MSPYYIITYPLLNYSVSKQSHILAFSESSNSFNISTLSKKSSNISLLLITDDLIILLNNSLSNEYSSQSSIAVIVAALGALYIKANSPNTSPGVYFFKNLSSLSPGNNFLHSVSPFPKIYNSYPSSSYLMIY